ncbi:hypothetical protein BK702_00030 [Bacillus thuringiensis serovar cameroun]|nr:hypothetical protein BK702_00030 [Bacillus thuringiensis serovar cameroun]
MTHSHFSNHATYVYERWTKGWNPAAATAEYIEPTNTDLTFCGMVHIPHGFTYVPKGAKKLVYSVASLSIVQETSQKMITVEECGPVDVTLNVLKVVGNIPYIVTAKVQGDDGGTQRSFSKPKNQIDLSYTGSIPVDTVLKISMTSLPNYSIKEQQINVLDFQVIPVYDRGANLLRFTGTLAFQILSEKSS